MDKRIRIFFVHRTLRQSGAARQIFLIYQSLDRSQFTPSLIVQTDRKAHFRTMPEAEPLRVLSSGEFRPFSAVRELVTLIRQERPSVIQSFNTDGNLLTYLATRSAPVPAFIASMRNTNKSWPEILVERKISAAYDGMAVNSVATRDELLQRTHLPEHRIHVIPNGVDTDLFAPLPDDRVARLRHEYAVPPNTFVFLSVGRIARQKNHACTIRALALLRRRVKAPFVWYCVGLHENRNLYGRLRKLAADLGLQTECRFIESVTDIPALYCMADLSILSSGWEGMPNAVLESMACGRLVAVADTADNDSIVNHGHNGFRFPGNDPAALCSILESALTMGRAQIQSIGEQARCDMREQYSMQAMTNRYEQLYRQFAGR